MTSNSNLPPGCLLPDLDVADQAELERQNFNQDLDRARERAMDAAIMKQIDTERE